MFMKLTIKVVALFLGHPVYRQGSAEQTELSFLSGSINYFMRIDG